MSRAGKPADLSRLRTERARLAELLARRRKRHEAGGSLAAALIRVTHDLIRAKIAEARRQRRSPTAQMRRRNTPTADLFAA